MSELHPDEGLIKVTRTTTTYEPAAGDHQPTVVKRRDSRAFWVVGLVALVVIVVGVVYYLNVRNTPAAIQQSAVAADQGRAQTLSQQAVSAQQDAQAAQDSADASQKEARSRAALAALDRAAARKAAANADNASH